MNKNEFEKALFAYLDEKSLVLKPLNVAYALGVDVALAGALLDELCSEGVIELVSGQKDTATYRLPGHATYDVSPAESAVSKPISPRAINRMAMDLQMPGLGSLVTLSPVGCLPVLALFVGAIVMVVMLDGWSNLWAAVPILVACVWSILVSIFGYFKDDRSGKDTYLQ